MGYVDSSIGRQMEVVVGEPLFQCYGSNLDKAFLAKERRIDSWIFPASNIANYIGASRSLIVQLSPIQQISVLRYRSLPS